MEAQAGGSSSQPHKKRLSIFSDERCSICDSGLRVQERGVGSSTGGRSTTSYLDDVQLRCGHHFHWTCITEHFESTRGRGGSSRRCPLCDLDAVDGEGRLLVRVVNEGGVTEGFDLGAQMEEERLMEADPKLRFERAFLAMVAEGDYAAASDLIAEHAVDVNCRYAAGGEGEGKTALHVAAVADDVDGIAWLLGAGADLGVVDLDGRTAGDYARMLGNERAMAALE